MSSHEHFIDRCSCGIIINQCRCFALNKKITEVKNGCIECKAKVPAKQSCSCCGQEGVDLSATDKLCIWCFNVQIRPERMPESCRSCRRDYCPNHCPSLEILIQMKNRLKEFADGE